MISEFGRGLKRHLQAQIKKVTAAIFPAISEVNEAERYAAAQAHVFYGFAHVGDEGIAEGGGG